MAGKNVKDMETETGREKMREPDTELQEYGTSYHLVELYSTVLSSEPLTVRPVAVFHSHEVFTLHCSTSVCHSITGSLDGSVNTVYYYIQYPLFLQSVLCLLSNVHLQHLTEARCSKAKYYK